MALFTIEWVYNQSGAARPTYVTQPEAASQTFKKGDPLTYDLSANGVAQLPLSSGEPAGGNAMFGLAAEDASGTTANPVSVQLVSSGDVFSAMLSSDINTLVAPTTDHVGVLMGIEQITTSATNAAGQAAAGTEFALDTGQTDWVRVIGRDPRDLQRRGLTLESTSDLQAGDRVLFQFLDSVSRDVDGQDT